METGKGRFQMSAGLPPSPRPASRALGAAHADRDTARPGGRVSRLPLVLGAASGILLCALALAILFLVNGQPVSPRTTGQALCADLEAQNYDAAYSLLAPGPRGAGTSAQFAASQRELDALNGKVVSCTATIQHADSAQASLLLTVTRQRTGTAQGSVHLQLLDGTWKVDAYDTATI